MDRDLRRITRELGGSYVANPLWSVLGRLITVHPLGGAGISDDPGGVVDAFGEVRNYPNLFVVDGSMIPRAIGPNPADNPTPHNGIECAAERNPNIESIAAFECPKP